MAQAAVTPYLGCTMHDGRAPRPTRNPGRTEVRAVADRRPDVTDACAPPRRSISRTILSAANGRRTADGTVTIASVMAELGDRSFAWAVIVFSMLNLIPAPPGSTLLLALPLLLITGQMALGARHLTLPDFVTRRRVPAQTLRRGVIKLRPIMRQIERVLRPRRLWLFGPRNEQLLGLWMFVVAVALYIPLPLSGAFPAWSLVVTSVGLLERDGTVTLIGVVLGAASVAVTAAVVAAVAAGVETLL
jgi:hypothetical protein